MYPGIQAFPFFLSSYGQHFVEFGFNPHHEFSRIRFFRGSTALRTKLQIFIHGLLETQMMAIQRITESYPIETFDDYSKLSDEELDAIKDLLQVIAFDY
jgi:hypothetical protein